MFSVRSRHTRAHGLAVVIAAVGVLPSSVVAQTDSNATSQPRLFHNRPYGSDTQFNPASVIVNEGFDMLRIITSNRAIGDIPYGESTRGIWNSLTHPDAVLRHYGWSRWARTELFPLSFRGTGAGKWAPNYQLHLFGAGMTYAHMTEWYGARGVGRPRLAAAATLFAGHFLNEIVENAGNPASETEEGLTDLLIFDPAGMLLWNTTWMRRAFSGSWEVNNWYGQPTWIPSTRRLENSFSAYYVRAPLPRTNDWKLFALNGNAFLTGVSRRLSDSLMLSIGGGVISVDVPVNDVTSPTTPVRLAPNLGIFVDRNGSLLASFINRAGHTNGPTLNVYPGVLNVGPVVAGFWVQAARGGYDGRGIRWGITSTVGGGIGSVAR
jgi:hypothetical protein